MISCFRRRVLLFGLRGNVKLVANSNSHQDEVQKARRFLHRRGAQNRPYRSGGGGGKGVQNLIVRNSVVRSPEEQHPRQGITNYLKNCDHRYVNDQIVFSSKKDQRSLKTIIPQNVRSMLSRIPIPMSPETPSYKSPGDFMLNALEDALLTFRSQSDRSEREKERAEISLVCAIKYTLRGCSEYPRSATFNLGVVLGMLVVIGCR